MTTATCYVSVKTPLGTFGMLLERRDGADVAVASGFTDLDGLCAMLPGVRPAAVLVADGHPYAGLVERYFSGDVRALDSIPTDQPGGEFFHSIWQAMSRIPPGRPLTYGELAAKAGRPKAVRAAGSACSRNRVALLVPCHRVVPSGGTSTGNYLYGSAIKRYLLAHEARRPGGPSSDGRC